MNSRNVKIVILIGILCITIIRCLHFSWAAPAQRWDEQTNEQVISELRDSENPFFLTYTHKPFFEKPPVWYAVVAAISRITHISPLVSARLLSAVSGFFIILLSCTVAYRWWGFAAGIITWSVLISTNHLFITNPNSVFSTHTIRSADSDIFYILLMLVASVLCVSARASRNTYIAIGCITAVAILTKGPLAIVPIVTATIIPYLSQSQKYTPNIRFVWLYAIVVPLLWFLYMTVNFGSQFITEQIGYHIVQRVITPIETHTGSVFFYMWLLSMKPLFLFFEVYLLSVFVYFRYITFRSDIPLMHVCTTSIVLLCIPSVVQTKLAWYILPFYPYAALTIAGIVTTSKVFRTFSAKWI